MFPIPRLRPLAASTLLLASVSVPALAETFDAQSHVTEATLYPRGAMVTREVTVTVPEGAHEVVLSDIPPGSNPAGILRSLQVEVTGARLGSIAYGEAELREAELYRSEAAEAAKARLDALEETMRERKQEIEAIRLEGMAAEDTLAYLNRLTVGEGQDASQMAAIARMVRDESLAARQARQEAEQRAAEAERDLKELREDIAAARAEVKVLVPYEGPRLEMTVPVTVEAAGEVTLRVSYMSSDAYWEPRYTAELGTEDRSLSLTRAVYAVQQTAEYWDDVALSFATDNPNRKAAPEEVYEQVRRVFDPSSEPKLRSSMAMADAAAPMIEEALMMEREEATVSLNGLSQTYRAPDLASLASGPEGREFALSTLDLSPDVFVRAVPLYEEVGYLMAGFTNDSGELLVPGEVRLIRDGVSLGSSYMEAMAEGAESELAFGPVEGLRVARILESRNEGDRGMISKRTEEATAWRIEVENLTRMSWPIEVLDRVSVTEQDDLKIDWTATPAPDEETVEDRRGVLAWRFDLDAGATQTIQISETLRWPEGQILD